MSYERVRLDFADGVAVLRFSHPEVMNAVGPQMLAELSQAVAEVKAAGPRARCLLLTGEGRGFCSGANLQAVAGGDVPVPRSALRSGYHPLLLELRELDMPMLSAVNGAAAGIGMSFAIMADIVCAARSAYFLQAFARVGLVPDGGATWLLPRLVGHRRALELSLLADRLPAEKALEWGLVNFVFDDADLLPESMKLARRLAEGPRSLGLMRRLYWQSAGNSYEAQLDAEAHVQGLAGATEDFREGVRAFLDKRQPRFSGR
jgi:2-(1,2-epoxy-1,2-dihydrophenyl)acetyl-CoA isomerase